ncbi:MAG: RluA family pseudouridine synthase [Candidatus Omnitrophota bacterium]
MEKRAFKVGQIDKPVRIDVYLVDILGEGISRSHIKRLIDNGNVSVNGERVKAHHNVKLGHVIEVALEELAAFGLEAEDISLDIIYEDEDIIVLNKPPFMAVHPGAGIHSGTLVNALLHHCGNLSTVNDSRPGIVHRLDKDTSGVMVVAKNNAGHTELARQFKERRVKKRYVALVSGIMELDEGIIDLPIGRHPTHREKMAVRHDSEKNAITEYKVIRRFGNFTAVSLNLKTGRTHQIRVHMAHIGHPLLGDSKYGGKGGKFPRQALHSCYLNFTHPRTGENMEFTAKLPADMKEAVCGDDLGIY